MTTTAHPIDQVGRFLIVGFAGTEPEQVRETLTRFRPAGLVLLPRNIVSPTQVRSLTDGIRAIAKEVGLPPPLLATDQEGGSVLRLGSGQGFVDIPSAMMVAASGEPGLVREVARLIGATLQRAGIDVALAPVLDLASDPRNEVIGSRSFGSEPVAVAEAGRIVIETLQEMGIAAVAKHFPGHGATATDSHLALPILQTSERLMRARDLVPFRVAIDAGVAAIMTAHVVTPFDQTLPATFSPAVMTGLLRSNLGFDGVLIADSLEMAAVSAAGLTTGEAAVRAIHAGVDLLIFDGDRDRISRASAGIREAIAGNRISDARMVESGRRVAGLRARTRISPTRIFEFDAADMCAIAEVGCRYDPAPRRGRPGPVEIMSVGAGPEFAAETGLRLAADSLTLTGGSRVIVVDVPEDLPALHEVERDVVVILSGARSPEPHDLRGADVLLGLDLPRSLWGAIGHRLSAVDRDPRAAD